MCTHAHHFIHVFQLYKHACSFVSKHTLPGVCLVLNIWSFCNQCPLQLVINDLWKSARGPGRGLFQGRFNFPPPFTSIHSCDSHYCSEAAGTEHMTKSIPHWSFGKKKKRKKKRFGRTDACFILYVPFILGEKKKRKKM